MGEDKGEGDSEPAAQVQGTFAKPDKTRHFKKVYPDPLRPVLLSYLFQWK